MDTISDLTVKRYDSENREDEIPADTPWTSTGESGPKLIIEVSEPIRVNQLEFITESGQPVKVSIKAFVTPDASDSGVELFNGQPQDVNSGERLDVPTQPEITNVYVIVVTFYTSDSQIVKVFGCIEKGKIVFHLVVVLGISIFV